MHRDITLFVNERNHMEASSDNAGYEGDHNFTKFVIKKPSLFDEYICRVEFNGDEKSYRIVKNDTFSLPNSLTKNGELEIQLIFSRPDGKVVGKTNIVPVYIDKSINAVDPTDEEYQDGLAQLAGKVSDHENRIAALEESGGGSGPGEKGDPGDSAYEIAVQNGFEGSVQDWLDSLKGSQGTTPHIGDNGNWFIGDTDTWVSATGPQGESFDPADLARIGALEARTQSMWDSMERIEPRLAGHSMVITRLEMEIESLQETAAANKSKISANTADIEELKANVDGLKIDMQGLNNSITAVRSIAAANENNIATNTSNIADLQDAIGDIGVALDSILEV